MLREANTAGLALLFSLKHDFPNEWAAFVNGAKDFTATIRRDHFPYFTQGREITITVLEIYTGAEVSKHHAVGSPDNATNELGSKQAFTITAGEDTAEPKVLTRTADKQVFLIVSYPLP